MWCAFWRVGGKRGWERNLHRCDFTASLSLWWAAGEALQRWQYSASGSLGGYCGWKAAERRPSGGSLVEPSASLGCIYASIKRRSTAALRTRPTCACAYARAACRCPRKLSRRPCQGLLWHCAAAPVQELQELPPAKASNSGWRHAHLSSSPKAEIPQDSLLESKSVSCIR